MTKRSHITSARQVRSAGVALLIASSIVASAQEPKITSVKRIGNDVELKFIGTSGTTYSVQQAGELVGWRPTGDTATGTGVEQTLLVAGAGTETRNFLRLAYTIVDATPGYVRIPSGSFIMGDQSVPFDGLLKERPAITLETGSFLMQTTEVTKAEWDATFTWAIANGYSFGSQAGAGKGPDHPVTNVNWYDAIKWCNARSEMEGLPPPYTYLVSGRQVIFRILETPRIYWNFQASGYRLPCEAEWEKAARGGVVGRRFPSGNTIDHSVANFFASRTTYTYDTTGVDGHHPAYNTGAVPYTSPVASFPPNPYGLHDMEANVREHCWDNATSDWSEGYTVRADSGTSLTPRTIRSGDWSNTAITCRSSYRNQEFPDARRNYLGFRTVKGPLN